MVKNYYICHNDESFIKFLIANIILLMFIIVDLMCNAVNIDDIFFFFNKRSKYRYV